MPRNKEIQGTREIEPMAKPYRTGMARRVREGAKALDCPDGFSRMDLYHHIDDIKPFSLQEEKSFMGTFKELFRRGEFKRIRYGRYRYEQEFVPQANVRQRIYRAMHVKGAFCANDIKILTDADRSYIQVTIRRLKKAGHLDLTGRSSRGNIFRVKHPEKFYLEMVHDKAKSNKRRREKVTK